MERRAYQERTAVLGITIFVASWTMLFAALFFAYGLVRLRTPDWPPTDLPRIPLLLPAFATLALGLSSAMLERASRRFRMGRTAGEKGILLALLLGAVFLGLQILVWRDLWLGGLRPSSGTYASVFFGLTVFHALHVVVGLGALAWLAISTTIYSAKYCFITNLRKLSRRFKHYFKI